MIEFVMDSSFIISLYKADMLCMFFSLRAKIIISDFSLQEIDNQELLILITDLTNRGCISVQTQTSVDFSTIGKMISDFGISVGDCSALQLAQENRIRLLSSDAKIIDIARKNNIEAMCFCNTIDYLLKIKQMSFYEMTIDDEGLQNQQFALHEINRQYYNNTNGDMKR